MADNPLKYSDLIQKDDSIQQVISELEQLKATYLDTLSVIPKEAAKVKVAMEQVSGATEQGREAIKKNATEADRLSRAQKELAFAMSQVGQQVAALKLQTNERNALSREESKMVNAQSTSYREMKAQLTILRTEYYALSQSERESEQIGMQKLAQIIDLNTQIKAIEKSMRAHNNTQDEEIQNGREVKQVLTDLEKARMRLTYVTSDENQELMQLNMETRKAKEIARLNLIINNEVEGSYNRLSAQYSLNKIKLNEMSMEWRETTAEGKAFVAETNNIYQQMIKLQSATGKHTLSVGNYTKGWDGLGNSVSQLVRELPSLAMSANMFFLAISNNIPIMVDEIDRLKDRNAALRADNIATIPVWKSVLKSFMSWNTIMMVGVSLLTIFGGDLVDWIKKMLKGGEALDANTIAAKKYAEAMGTVREAQINGAKDAQKDVIRLKLLYNATQDQTKKMRERLAAVDELQRQYPSYFKNLTDEEILAGKAAGTYAKLTSEILKSAKARAYENQIVKNSEKILELEKQQAKAKSAKYSAEVLYNEEVERRGGKSLKAQIKLMGEMGVVSKNVADAAQLEGVEEGKRRVAYEEAAQVYEGVTQEILSLTRANEKLAQSVDVDALVNPPSEEGKKKRDKEDRTLEIRKKNLEALAKFQESETALLEDGMFKRRQLLIDNYDKERLELENQLKNEKDLTEEGKQAIRDTLINKNILLMNDLAKVEEEGNLERLKLEEEYLKLRLELVEKGTLEEADLKILVMENARQREIIENDKLTVEMRQSEAAINEKWDKLIAKQRQENSIALSMEAFDRQQAYEESLFNLISHSSYKTNVFRLNQEKDRWTEVLRVGAVNGKKLTEQEIKTIQNIIAGIEREVGGQDKDIFDLLGLDLDDEQKSAINESTDFIMSQFKSILAAQVELADIAVRKNEERVASAQDALNQEIEARNAGYAHSVATAQKALDIEKKNLQKSQREREKAAKAQEALDTVMQATSLITATAGIWKSLSSIPYVGWILALAATATMWGSFAAAKIKARQVTKAQSYGEGGFEILDGGSHASGNDIHIGTTKDGRDRRAEGGETLAIIKKSSTRKYRSIIPDIVKSLNKGTFEQRYMQSFDTGNYNLNVSQSLDTKELEDDVKAIKEQGKKKYFVNGKGETVEIYKNRIRIYR